MVALEKEPAIAPAPISGKRAPILYLSFDGLLEPLGRSQILRYLCGLSRRGFPYTVISLERESDLADITSVRELERELQAHGVRWIHLSFRTGGVKAVSRNCSKVFRAARAAIRRDGIRLIHARSYVPASIGWILRLIYGTPYLFDMRGYWVDELADEGRWFTNRFAYKIGKQIEKILIRDSTAITTLTEIQANDIRAGLSTKARQKPIEVITTCADYDDFNPSRPLRGVVPGPLRARFEGKLTVGLVGAINTSYLLNESLLLFSRLLEERPDAHLICLTRQVSEMKALLGQHGIPEEAYTLTSVPHGDMSEWLRHMDWALLLMKTGYSKRGSMPTKLAEFFAAGVRPIQYGCNAEVSQKVREASSGIVLRSLAPEHLSDVARKVAATALLAEDAMKARDLTRSHFSLQAGVEKYEALLNKVQ